MISDVYKEVLRMLQNELVYLRKREKQIQYANTYIWNLRGKKNGHEEPRGKTEIKTQTY